MTLGQVLALACIIVGFIVGVADVHILFEPLVWFVAAVAFDLTLGSVGIPGRRGE